MTRRTATTLDRAPPRPNQSFARETTGWGAARAQRVWAAYGLWETPRMARDFTKVGVIGLGTMGAGIVEVFARNGIDVVAVEVSDEAVEKGRGVLANSTARAVVRGKLTEDEQAALHARVHFTSDMGDLRDCQLVVE